MLLINVCTAVVVNVCTVGVENVCTAGVVNVCTAGVVNIINFVYICTSEIFLFINFFLVYITANRFVTREFTRDFSYSFDNLSGHATPEVDLALLTFAYKENIVRHCHFINPIMFSS
jgi:hypothetical protein